MKFKKIDNNIKLEALRIKKRDLEEDSSGMQKFHMTYTVDGIKSEQTVSAVNVQKAEELIKKQYEGKNVSFTSKQEVKEDFNPIEDMDAQNAYNSLKPGDKFKNRLGTIITIVDPTKDDKIQYKIGDEVRIGSERSIKNMLYRNNYIELYEQKENLEEKFGKQEKYDLEQILDFTENNIKIWKKLLSKKSYDEVDTGYFDSLYDDFKHTFDKIKDICYRVNPERFSALKNESLKENYEYVKRAFAFDIYKDGDDFVLLNGDGDEVYRSNNTLDCLKWARKNSSKYYKADMSFDLDSWNNDFLHEDLAALIQQLHDKDEYLWNLHNNDYEWLYDECSKYSDCWGSADCQDTIADCVRKMPKDAQYKLLDRLVEPLHESLNEDLESPEKVIENAEKVPQTDEEAGLSNMIIKEINGEWETISHYNDLISVMRREGRDNMIDVISDIVDEENKHVGQLQKCLQILSPNVSEIDSGESEAEEQLDVSEECEFCADDDFGPNSGFDIYLV